MAKPLVSNETEALLKLQTATNWFISFFYPASLAHDGSFSLPDHSKDADEDDTYRQLQQFKSVYAWGVSAETGAQNRTCSR